MQQNFSVLESQNAKMYTYLLQGRNIYEVKYNRWTTSK